MLSNVRPPTNLLAMKYNLLWDGLFHAATWLMTSAGVGRLWLAAKRDEGLWSTSGFVGALLLGWGLFNALEGLIDHQILGIHHVRPGRHQLAWDLGFLGSGVLMIAAGAWLVRRAHSTQS
jgi:uncharacterized membrane protein